MNVNQYPVTNETMIEFLGIVGQSIFQTTTTTNKSLNQYNLPIRSSPAYEMSHQIIYQYHSKSCNPFPLTFKIIYMSSSVTITNNPFIQSKTTELNIHLQ